MRCPLHNPPCGLNSAYGSVPKCRPVSRIQLRIVVGFTGRGKLNGRGWKCQGTTSVVPQTDESKNPPAEPGDLRLVAPQTGLCRSVHADSSQLSRTVGAVVISPALQRGESVHIWTGPESRRDGAHAPLRFFCRKKLKAKTASDSRNCQTSTVAPAEPGVFPLVITMLER